MSEIDNRLAIQELVCRYATMVDTFQLEETLDCWLDDAVFDESESGYGVLNGKNELRAFFRDKVFAGHKLLSHLTGNHLVNLIDDENATGSVFLMAEAITKDGIRSRMVAMYEDQYRKDGGKWRFCRRAMRRVFPREYSHTTPPSRID